MKLPTRTRKEAYAESTFGRLDEEDDHTDPRSHADRMTGFSLGHVKVGGIQLSHHGKGSRPTISRKCLQCLAARLGDLVLPLFESSALADGC